MKYTTKLRRKGNPQVPEARRELRPSRMGVPMLPRWSEGTTMAQALTAD